MFAGNEHERSPLGLEPASERLAPPRIRMPGSWPLRFVLGSLIALAVVPTVIGKRIQPVEAYVWEVLDPARHINNEIVRLHSRQRARFESYLLTGSPEQLGEYEALRELESARFAELDSLLNALEPSELRILFHAGNLGSAALRWHMRHDLVKQGQMGRQEYLANVAEDQALFEDILTNEQALTDELVAAMDEARAEMDQERSLQVMLTAVLAALALLATGAAGLVGMRLRSLVAETEERRREASGARRDLQATLEATGDGVLGFDLAGRCTVLNATGARLLRISEGEALGRTVHELLHGAAPEEERHSRQECPIFDAIRSGAREREREEVFWRRDGTSFLGKWQFRPLRDGRLLPGGVLTLTDMTEIRTAEEALKQAVHDRDQVVAVVSHDLRNPLGTIIAASELLLEVDLGETKSKEQLRIIRRASRRMSRLIEDLLDVSRIEAGGLTVSPEPIELEPLLKEAVELHLPLVHEKNVQLGSELQEDLPRVLADHDRVLQVLSNLIGNAFQHTQPGGRVTVTARARANDVILSVIDTGEGIDREDLERLFDRFWQARIRGRSGAGLGLAIVKGIVEAHGGRVWVESVRGEGSAFHFTLPVSRAEAPVSPAEPQSLSISAWQERRRAGA
jgi:PAS domain S-box-containing protein